VSIDDTHDGENGRAKRASGGTLLQTVNFGLAFARWCEARRVRTPDAVREGDYEQFANALDALNQSREYSEVNLHALSRLARAGSWVDGPAMPTPPWVRVGVDAYLSGDKKKQGENNTQPLSQAVAAPLITWALRFVCDFSDDILAAKEERTRLLSAMRKGNPNAGPVLRTYFQGLRDRRESVPAVFDRATGSLAIASKYIAGLTGTSHDQVRYYLKREFADLPVDGPALVLSEVRGRVGDQPWRDGISFEDVRPLMTLLHSAALIVVGYLTGMRPAELLTLRRGCCTTTIHSSGKRVHSISGKKYKRARQNGAALADGLTREQPWYAIDQVAKAIEVVERLHDDDLLWPAKPPWSRAGAETPGEPSMRSENATLRIASFIEATRALTRQLDRPHEVIPDVGRIAIGQFRRTLAWFIVWQPGGDIAAGLQYGHLEPLTTQGYASRARSRGGIGDLIDMERLRRVVDMLHEASERLDEGERISGPATGRYFDRVGQFREHFPGRTLTERQMRSLRSTTELRIYDSPKQVLTCVMDPTRAACLTSNNPKDGRTTPNITRCSDKCANGVRTDRHAEELARQAAELRSQAVSALLPEPIRYRQLQRAELLEAKVQEHEKTARTWSPE